MTPLSAWEHVAHLLPKDKVVWEPFYGDGASGQMLRNLGFTVIHEEIDFFLENKGDILVSNPPFSKGKEVFARLKKLDKPFMMIMPASKICTQYVRGLFANEKLQIIIPKHRIHFTKLVDGKVPDGWNSSCNFDCFYYCWKLDLPSDIVWLT